MCIDRWVDKEVSVHIHNGILPGYKKEHVWDSSKEVDYLKSVIQSEVSQKEKDKYCLLTHIYGILKVS